MENSIGPPRQEEILSHRHCRRRRRDSSLYSGDSRESRYFALRERNERKTEKERERRRDARRGLLFNIRFSRNLSGARASESACYTFAAVDARAGEFGRSVTTFLQCVTVREVTRDALDFGSL